MTGDYRVPDSVNSEEISEVDLAIVGLSGRFPGAADLDQYWENLSGGVESITEFSEQDLLAAGVPAHLVSDPNYVKAAPVLDNAARFDAALFGYSPRDARTMDPQQRQLLELAWSTMEHAGYDPHRYEGRVATYASTAMNTYLLQSGLGAQFTEDYLPTLLGSDKDFQATRIAYKLGLTGPAITVQTACSSSLVALHLACQGLLSDECDMALVGAAAVRAPLAVGHLYEEGSVFTPDGHCKPFDAAANGTIFGSGAGMVLVKRLGDAVRDRDTVWAVVRGTAINNDGDAKADYTAPSIGMQADVISEALGKAGVGAESISYVEAHGTGTYLGDPIELEALTRAFRNDSEGNQYCGIGSVKSNIGHLDAAAGLASLIKVVLAMRHRQLPPTLHFSAPNPQIDFANSPFRVVSQLQDWQPAPNSPRRAGITSLGMGGTNAHVVLEEPDPALITARPTQAGPQILVLSARTDSALDKNLTALAAHCRAHPDLPIQDIAFTLLNGRQALGKRRALVASTASEVAELIETRARGRVVSARVSPTERDVIFMFPGQGSQYPGMAKGLYDTEPVFRDVIDTVAQTLESDLQCDLRAVMFATSDDAASNLAQTALTQPALFAVEYAYAMLLQSWGIIPAAMIGHSIGEYTAAAVAGVFDLQTGARLVAARGKLMQAAPRGSMLAVNLPAQKLSGRLCGLLDLAVVNGVDMAVAAGPDDAIEALKSALERDDIGATILQTSHAFHSAMMEPATREFADIVAQFELSPPTIPFVSNMSGDWITTEQATDPTYWATHIRSTVNFSDGLNTLFARSPSLMMEVGPGTTLSSLAQQHPARGKTHAALPAGRHPSAPGDDRTICLGAVGGLWTAAVELDWSKFLPEDARRVPLPTYSFEGDEHWFTPESDQSAVAGSVPAAGVTTLMREPQRGDWHWSETFQPLPSVGFTPLADAQPVLITGDVSELSAAVKTGLSNAGWPVNDQTSKFTATRTRADFDQLIDAVDRDGQRPADIIYIAPAVIGVGRAQRVFLELMHLAQALCRWDGLHNCRLRVICANGYAPANEAACDPFVAMLGAAVKTITTEWPHLSTCLIDVDRQEGFSAGLIGNELAVHGRDSVVALRSGQRWVQTVAPNWLVPAEWSEASRRNCVLVGAFGGVGAEVAKYMAGPGVKLGLLSRQVIPARSQWQSIVSGDPNRPRVDLVLALEASGCEVTLMSADVCDTSNLRMALDLYAAESGVPQLVFHLGGVIDDAPLYGKPDQAVTAVLAPKVQGTLNLHEWVASQSDCRLVLFSSISAVMTPAGQIDYSAANAFQNAFARATAQVTSVAWPGWRDIGMAARIADPALRAHAGDTGVDPDDAMACLASILVGNVSSAIVSPVNVQATLRANAAQLTVNAASSSAMTAGSTPDAPAAGASSADRISQHWCALLGFDPQEVCRDDSYFDLGGTSLVAVKLFARLEREFGISLPVELLLGASSINELAAVIDEEYSKPSVDEAIVDIVTTPPAVHEAGSESPKQACLVPIRAGSTNKPPFYFIHAHGGTVIGYQDVVRRMDKSRPIWGLQSQGIRGDVAPLQTIEAMAAHYVQEILQANPHGPYLLGGYCMGGTIAWEIARQLEAGGHRVGLLVMIKSFHRDYPTYPDNVNLVKKKAGPYLDWLHAINMRDTGGRAKLPFFARTIWSAGMRKMQTGVDIDLENAGGSEALAAIHDANGLAFWKYHPGPLHAPVIFFSAKHQPMGIVRDISLGYCQLATGWKREISVPGSFLNGMAGLDMDMVVRHMQACFELDKTPVSRPLTEQSQPLRGSASTPGSRHP